MNLLNEPNPLNICVCQRVEWDNGSVLPLSRSPSVCVCVHTSIDVIVCVCVLVFRVLRAVCFRGVCGFFCVAHVVSCLCSVH